MRPRRVISHRLRKELPGLFIASPLIPHLLFKRQQLPDEVLGLSSLDRIRFPPGTVALPFPISISTLLPPDLLLLERDEPTQDLRDAGVGTTSPTSTVITLI